MSNKHSSRIHSSDAVTTTQKKPLGWVKIVGGGLLLIVGFILALKLAGFLIKWGILLLLLYGAYRLIRYLLSGASSEEPESVLQLDDEPEDHVLDLLESDLELEELKLRVKSASTSDD